MKLIHSYGKNKNTILMTLLFISLQLIGCSSTSSYQNFLIQQEFNQRQYKNCLEICAGHYATAKDSCSRLSESDNNALRRDEDYARCLRIKGFPKGEATYIDGCKKDINFYKNYQDL